MITALWILGCVFLAVIAVAASFIAYVVYLWRKGQLNDFDPN